MPGAASSMSSVAGRASSRGGRVGAAIRGTLPLLLDRWVKSVPPVASGTVTPFVHRLRVRYHECDAQGVVFNANWFTYFDVTLTEWFREAFGSYGALMESGSDVVLAETTARFNGSAHF